MKDKLAGYSIFVLSVLVIIAYLLFTIWGLVDWGNQNYITNQVTIILLAVPVMIGMFVVFGIAAWIGWTMAITPPPAPIDLEDFEKSEEAKEEKKFTKAKKTSTETKNIVVKKETKGKKST